jgi:F-type H+-transporting ATPase subunit b
MDLVTPGLGLIVWTTVTFIILLFILGKFAWKPILKAVKDREQSIEESLEQAAKARQDMEKLQSDNEKIAREARADRDAMLKEARELKATIISEAKTEADKKANDILEQAKEQINNQKMAAITELKNQVAEMSIEIAETVLRKELESKDKQSALVNDQLADFKLN